MAKYKPTVRKQNGGGRQLATRSYKAYFEVVTITPPPSKPAIVFSCDKGDNTITLTDAINSKILTYSHWKDVISLCDLTDNQFRAIQDNKRLMHDLTMQCIDEIIKNLNKKTTSNEHHFVLKNRVSYRATDGNVNSGYIVRTSKKSVWIVHCDEIFGDEPVVRMLRNSNVKHVQPFVGEVENTVINYRMVDPRNEL